MTIGNPDIQGRDEALIPPISDVITVANEILKEAKRSGLALTSLQLVKLTYIAHGFSMAILGRCLYSARVEAWRYGPVIPTLYYATKEHGQSPIPHALIDASKPSPLDEEVNEFIRDFVSKYGVLSAYELSSLTHEKGTPWSQVHKPGKTTPIDNARIAAYYRNLIDEDRRSQAA